VTCLQCDQYNRLANALVILFDADRGVHPEYQGYAGELIKQADVVLLHYPLGMDMPDEVRKADLEYYSARTDLNGPAMTWGMHSIGFLDLHDDLNAAKYFNMSFQDNMHEPLQVWTETVSFFSIVIFVLQCA
jgi:protein-glucosylgalactosylhydroxylysine glucosidase